jgi:hypothetical protein
MKLSLAATYVGRCHSTERMSSSSAAMNAITNGSFFASTLLEYRIDRLAASSADHSFHYRFSRSALFTAVIHSAACSFPVYGYDMKYECKKSFFTFHQNQSDCECENKHPSFHCYSRRSFTVAYTVQTCLDLHCFTPFLVLTCACLTVSHT